MTNECQAPACACFPAGTIEPLICSETCTCTNCDCGPDCDCAHPQTP